MQNCNDNLSCPNANEINDEKVNGTIENLSFTYKSGYATASLYNNANRTEIVLSNLENVKCHGQEFVAMHLPQEVKRYNVDSTWDEYDAKNMFYVAYLVDDMILQFYGGNGFCEITNITEDSLFGQLNVKYNDSTHVKGSFSVPFVTKML